MKDLSPILFGRVLGLAALGMLSRKLLWPDWVSMIFVGAALAYAGVLLAAAASGRFSPKALQDNLAYGNWLFAALCLVSPALVREAQVPLWCLGAVGALIFAGVGVSRIKPRSVGQVDPAAVAWVVPLIVACETAPWPSVITPWVENLTAGVTFSILALSMLRVIRQGHFQGLRSLWYGVGGSAVLATLAVGPLSRVPQEASWQVPALALTGAMGVFWLIGVLATGLHTHGPWSNLFSICSVSNLCATAGYPTVAMSFFMLALGALTLDLRPLLVKVALCLTQILRENDCRRARATFRIDT